ncbi:MAG: pitrilysin family protein [Prolixibacteraceae bacterium]
MKKAIFLIVCGMIITILSCSVQNKESGLSIPFEKYTLPNGLTVILNVDHSDPMVSQVMLYHVGSSRETPGKTGFAHLFEHMMFQQSENIVRGQFDKELTNVGGENNGFTSEDATNYYENVPSNALEIALWLESDRMGYLSNTVTKNSLANQQNVVQNEKRQSVDNSAYGFKYELITKNLYPVGHPYSWTVIGKMEDLTNATVEDVKAFHSKFYSPNNATLVISGDFDPTMVKTLVEKYYGEIPAGQPVEKRVAMPVSLSSTKKLYHEDNFAKVPQITIVYPGVEQYTKEAYALDFLGELLAGNKKSPLYILLVKEKKLTSAVSAYNESQELAGNFSISVTANTDVNLTEVEKTIFEGLRKFEKDGFTEEDITQIKNKKETKFYNNYESVLGKALELANYHAITGDPGYYNKELASIQAVTKEDIMNVYTKYVKDKNFVEVNFVPKGKVNLMAEGSVNAGIVEEDVTKAAEVKTEEKAEEPFAKTPTKFDRSKRPNLEPDPSLNIPTIWTSSLGNGMKILGIQHHELPLVQFSIVVGGGHNVEEIPKAGLASIVAALMNEGTKNRTPEELETAIGLLGANIKVTPGNDNITINVKTLTKNFAQTTALVEEMLLEPRWDAEQFELTKSRMINTIKKNRAYPNYLASTNMIKLLFGADHILSVDFSGTEASISGTTTEDLKSYYKKYFSPSNAQLVVAGDVDEVKVKEAFAGITKKWQPKEVVLSPMKVFSPPANSNIYFIDLPGAKQSYIYIGTHSMLRTNPDFYPLDVANYMLGGSFTSVLNNILREVKGFTYGAYSRVIGTKEYGLFVASSLVRTNSTLESVNIFKTEMEKYRKSMTQETIDITKNALIKGNAMRFETIGSLLELLRNISTYDLPLDYIQKEEAYLKSLTVEKQMEIVNKYIDPNKMYYVVVGDAKTQLDGLEKVGFGKPILIK